MNVVKCAVKMSKYNRDRCLAQLVDEDDIQSVDLAVGNYRNPQEVCNAAADYLEILAVRFRDLGRSDTPFNAAMQDELNKAMWETIKDTGIDIR